MRKYEAVGVAFKRAGKIYDFLSGDLGPKLGSSVVVETEKGEDLATVMVERREITVPKDQEMKRILRAATDKDIEKKLRNRVDELEALRVCKEYVTKHELDMKLLLAEYTLDRGKITFYYTADNRVDFRQLVKDLARIYRTRIEMRQIGVRDATKVLGGFGTCGRELCCASFLRNFDNISIKTAKGNNVIMNPSKISGVCGRLMCCLVYEKGCSKCDRKAIDVNLSTLTKGDSDDDLDLDLIELVVDGDDVEGKL